MSVSLSVRQGRARAEHIVRETIERIQAMEPQLHAWQTFAPELAIRQARALDQRIAAGQQPALLAGVPLAVKDIFDTADLPTAYGSAVYRGHQPVADAHPVQATRRAGAMVIGKTVSTEFAYFAPGPTANPCNVAHTPGGSSSGSAAAVASGMVPLAFGSQTAGSLIRPASYCGVFALKPTHGRFDLQGVKALSPSLDTLGWLARSADDLELMRCALLQQAYVPLTGSGASLRLGSSLTHEKAMLNAGGMQVWRAGLARLDGAGVALQPFDFPDSLAGLVDAHKTIMAYEAARNLAGERQAFRDLLSAQLVALLDQGDLVPASEYRAALALAEQGRRHALGLLERVDALLVPAAPGEAPLGLGATGDPVFSRVWTLLGLPCVSVPGLTGPQGLPVGLQLVGRPDAERALLQIAMKVSAALAGR